MKIGLDCNVLSSLINEETEFSNKILQYLNDQKSGKLDMVISNIVIAELYAYAEQNKVQGLINKLKEKGNVSIIPYDSKSAIENGILFKATKSSITPNTRQEIKSDILIVSNCIAYGCSTFLTNDEKMIGTLHDKANISFVKVSDLPEPATDLLGDLIIDK